MGLIARLGERFRARQQPRRALPMNVMPAAMTDLFGTFGERSLKSSEAICAAVTRLANTMGSLPLHLYKGYAQSDDDLDRLVSYAPNANMTGFGLRYSMMCALGIYGCAYAMILTDGRGKVNGLDVLDPARVSINRDRDTREIWYGVTLDDGQVVYVHTSAMIALKWGSVDGIHGISPIEVLGATLKYDKAIREISLKQLEGVNGAVVLTYPTALDPQRKAAMENRFIDAYKKSSGQVIVLEGGVTADRINGSVVDPEVLNADTITKSKVAAVYGIPVRLLGANIGSDYSTSEQATRELMTLTMLPWVTAWEEELDRKLLTWQMMREGYRFRFKLDNLLRGDTATVAERHSKLIRAGAMTPNEAREENNMPPLEYGDELMSARDLIPLRISVDHPEMLLGNTGVSKDEK